MCVCVYAAVSGIQKAVLKNTVIKNKQVGYYQNIVPSVTLTTTTTGTKTTTAAVLRAEPA